MGKRPKRPRFSQKVSAKSNTRDDDASSEDDEIDAFLKQRDMVPLDINDEAGDSEDEDLEQPVFDFESNDDDNSDDGKSDDDDAKDADEDDDGYNYDIHPKGFAAKIARQAKYLQQKFGGGEDEVDDPEEEEEEKKAVWGRRKNLYYSADNVDFELQSSDEDLPMEEEAEVLKIQKEKAKSFTMEDFGLEDADQEESNRDGQDKNIQDALVGKKAVTKHRVDGVLKDSPFEKYEEIKKDLNSLSKEEQMGVVYSSAPELVGLLSELNEALDQLKILKAVLCKVGQRKDTPKGRMHSLEVKHVLLLAYCQAISFYLLLKSEGHPVRDHPVIARLVEIKNLLEKTKQIDVKLPSQMEGLLDQNYVGGSRDKLVGESLPKKLEPEMVNETAALAKDGFSMDSENRSADQKHQDVQVGVQSLEMLKIRASLEEKLKQKGLYNFTCSKPERLQSNAPKSVNQHLVTVDDFDDEVQPNAVGGNLLKPRKLSQLVANKAAKRKLAAGDDDLPKRDDIGERRRKHELRVLARAGAPMDDIDDTIDEDVGPKSKSMDIDAQEEGESQDSEDEFYKEVKRQRTEKLMARAEFYSRAPVIPSSLETETDSKRHITYQMEKNRGLTRSRKKLTKIPRKKYKIKHQKAVVRRKGQVRDIRKPAGPYGGELTGINTSVSRSVRFKS